LAVDVAVVVAAAVDSPAIVTNLAVDFVVEASVEVAMGGTETGVGDILSTVSQ